MTKPADILSGTWIAATDIGNLTVLATRYDDFEDRYEVDVQPDPECNIWDVDVLARATGAQDAQWLCGLHYPDLRYRLYFVPDTDVAVTR